MEKQILIKKAKAIVTCNAHDEVLYDADILIEGMRIKDMGPDLVAPDAEIMDGRDKFVYPGLINTHHHFFQTFIRNQINIDYPNMHVVDWLKIVYPIFTRVTEDVIYYSSLVAMADLIKHGCTTAFDHQYCYTKASGKFLVDRQMQAARELGMRYHAGRGGNSLTMDQGSTIPDEMVESLDVFLLDCERLIALYHDDAPYAMSQVVVAPCQPINSDQHTFEESVRFARDQGVFLHTHLGEGENDLMVQRHGMRTLAWCQERGFVGPDVWIAHGWELQKEEYQVMADTGTGVSHCPGPAVLGGFPILDIPEMQKAGIVIGLGCDGSATNDGSNLLDSLRMAYLMQTFHGKVRGGSPSAYDMLKIATNGGASLLGRKDLGHLSKDMAADLFMVDTSSLELAGTLHDPQNLLARVGVTGNVYLTMINGKVVYREGVLLGIDEKKISFDANMLCGQVIGQI